MAQRLLDEPHHDGSPMYLPKPPTRLGEEFDVFLRVPHSAGISRVVARQVHDGEPFPAPADVVRTDAGATWWRARLTQRNPILSYRFLTDGGPNGYRWVTAAGVCDHDPTDATDFRSSVEGGGPQWLAGTVAYQIFPDRFARSQDTSELPLPDWAMPALWDDDPIWQGRGMGRQFYGGDLRGITGQLDHVAELGVNLIYLTPVFPAPSNHRYNASSFERVDPLLGGDEALSELVTAAHGRGMRVIGDFTTNHTGDTHEWFIAAQTDAEAPEARYFYFTEHPHDYEGWFGVPTLPKVDHGSPTLRDRMITDPDSPVRRFLREPFGLDGWRIDVANMTGRHRELDVTRDVARDVRAAVLTERPDAYIVAEHFHDFRDDLPGDGWHGVMNYAGFTKPIWAWLVGEDSPGPNWLGLGWPTWPKLPAEEVVRSMRAYTAVPWQHLLASMTLLSSHDTARIATIAGSEAMVEVAVGALMTYPGVPMVFAGDEIGLEGVTGEDARRPFPWHHPETWRRDTFDAYRKLIRIRCGSEALQRGSMRWLHADADRMVFVRELPHERVLVMLARAEGDEIPLDQGAIGLQEPDESETLYGSAAVQMQGDGVVLPGSGPAVHIWRWKSSSTNAVAGGGNHGESST